MAKILAGGQRFAFFGFPVRASVAEQEFSKARQCPPYDYDTAILISTALGGLCIMSGGLRRALVGFPDGLASQDITAD